MSQNSTLSNAISLVDLGPVFEAGDICVLWLATDSLSAEHEQKWHALLSDEEQQRAQSFRYATDRLSFIAAHALLRQALASLTGLHSLEVAIGKDLNGKPQVLTKVRTGPVYMNLTHTDRMVAVAFSRTAAIGIDIESMNRKLSPEITKILCSEQEILELAKLPGANQATACMELWTLKEAMVKVTGQGLRANITGICCSRTPPRLRQTGPLPGSPSEWSLYQGLLPGGFVWAVAQRSPRDRITLWSINPA